ncbi:MAG: hypothetical protein M3R02_01505 [Chloroflexota bacterium]|nr:hypothetical protein [Chloroflexota bacterium]
MATDLVGQNRLGRQQVKKATQTPGQDDLARRSVRTFLAHPQVWESDVLKNLNTVAEVVAAEAPRRRSDLR